MGNQRQYSIDDLVRTKLSYAGRTVSTVVEVGTPTLNTPVRDNADPLEWLHNPVGLDITPRHKVTWDEAGEIVSPCTKIRTRAAA